MVLVHKLGLKYAVIVLDLEMRLAAVKQGYMSKLYILLLTKLDIERMFQTKIDQYGITNSENERQCSWVSIQRTVGQTK